MENPLKIDSIKMEVPENEARCSYSYGGLDSGIFLPFIRIVRYVPPPPSAEGSTSALQSKSSFDTDSNSNIQRRPALWPKKVFNSKSKSKSDQAIKKSLVQSQSRKFKCSFCPLRFSHNVGKIHHEKKNHFKIIVSKDREIWTTKTHIDSPPPSEDGQCESVLESYLVPENDLTELDLPPLLPYPVVNHQNDKIMTQELTPTYSKSVHKRRSSFQKKKNNKSHSSQCYFCDKYFCNLNMHLVTHTKERPFKCLQCKKEFNQQSSLRTHGKTRCAQRATHPRETPFKCPQCKKGFTQKRSLKIHEETHRADGGRRFPCSFCPLRFTQKGNRRVHVKKIHPLEIKEDEDNDWEAVGLISNCNDPLSPEASVFEVKIGPVNQLLAQREIQDQNSKSQSSEKIIKNPIVKSEKGDVNKFCKNSRIRPYACFYTSCKKTFTQMWSLQRHVTTIHLGKNKKLKKFSCSYCPLEFAGKLYRIKHEKNVHLRMKDFKERQEMVYKFATAQSAPETDEVIDQESSLLTELRISSPTESHNVQKSTNQIRKLEKYSTSSFVCSHFGCKKEFTSKASLQRHEDTHGADGGRKFPCSYCSSRFKQKAHRLNHEKRVHFIKKKGKRSPAARFTQKISRIRDEEKIHNIVNIHKNDFNAGECNSNNGKTGTEFIAKKSTRDEQSNANTKTPPFTTASLDTKSEVGFPQRNLSCYFCASSFLVSYQLINHLRIHTNEMPFKCSNSGCNMEFTTDNELYRHMTIHHIKIE